MHQRPRGVDADKCTGCGDCWQACPVRNVPEAPGAVLPGRAIDRSRGPTLRSRLARRAAGTLRATTQPPADPCCRTSTTSAATCPGRLWKHLSVRLEIPLAEILRVASFYNAFSLEPVGRHIVEVCLGTACFVRGSGLLMERLEEEIGVTDGRPGEPRLVTGEPRLEAGEPRLGAGEPRLGADEGMRFTLRSVRCIGCLRAAPAMRIDGVTFGNVKLSKVPQILEQFE